MRTLLPATIVAAGLALASCGTDGSSSESSSKASPATAGTAEPATSGSTQGGTLAGVDRAVAYVNAKAGAAKPDLSPITIGFASQEGGTPSNPNALVAAKAAVKYINENLGGVDGHPLAMTTCNVVQTQQQGQACAQKFVNSKVPLVVTGGLSNGNEAFFQTLGKKVPVITGVGGSPADAASKDTLVLSAGVLGVAGSMSRYVLKRYKPKTVALVAPNVAITQLALKDLSASLQKAGVAVTKASFAPNASDLLTPLIAAKAKDADVLAGIIFTPQCTTVAKAIKQIGRTKPTVVLDLCIDPSVKKALGDYPKWDYLAVEEIAYTANPSPNVASYLAGLHKYAGPDADPNSYAGTAWAAMLSGVRIMNGLGADNVTRAKMVDAVAGFTAPSFITPAAKCGSIPVAPGLCSPNLFFYHYDGDGKFTDQAPGGA